MRLSLNPNLRAFALMCLGWSAAALGWASVFFALQGGHSMTVAFIAGRSARCVPAAPAAATRTHVVAAGETLGGIAGARCLVMLGDSVTTDHISPAGSIKPDSPAGHYLVEHGVERKDFNSYGSRRGNHEVMVRGTFANVRLRNQLAPGTEGGFTAHLRGILDDKGRPMVLINWNTDMGDGLEWSTAEDYPGYLKSTAMS